jgi:replicative DNA helicase
VAAIGGDGKNLTAEKWGKLASFGVRSVVLVLDNDEAGRAGTLAALENASKADNVPVVYVADPEKLAPFKDPDELVRKKSLEAFGDLLKSAKPGPVYRGHALLEEVGPTSPVRERQEAAGRVVEYIDGLHGPRASLDREDVLRLTAERTGYSAGALAELAEDRAERRRREEAERGLDASLREAQAERSKGRNVLEVAQALTEGLAKLRAHAEEPPPPFSVERLERESRELRAGRRSGWESVDHMEVRFHAGELALLAARTGHGKTSALVCLLRNWLETAGGTDEVFVLYSAEEPEARVFHRLLSLVSKREWTPNEARDFLRDPASRETWPWRNLDEEKEHLRGWEDRLFVVSRPSWSVAELEAHARTLAGSCNVGAVLVDYLQRVPPPPGHYDRRDLEVSAVARGLKSLAVDLSCPVVAAAQISREAVKDRQAIPRGQAYQDRAVQDAIRARRPQLHHLREGGSEQEADLVLGLLNYRADFEVSEEEEWPGSVAKPPNVTLFEVGVLKNRYGTPGIWAGLAFEGRLGLLRDRKPGEEL